MQSIAAAASLGHIELQTEIVASYEPVEGVLRLLIPTLLSPSGKIRWWPCSWLLSSINCCLGLIKSRQQSLAVRALSAVDMI
jgi:hypothetical protein